MEDPELKYPVNPNPSKSYSVFLCKTLFVALVLVILVLFPSQAPEFTNQTIVAKLWELLYLLFIGISISYGLFGRKRSEINRGIQPPLDNSQTYLSGIVHISSIFYSGYEDQCGSDEKRMAQTRNPLYFENGYENPYGFDDKIMHQTGKSQFLESEWKIPRSLNSEKDLEISLFDEKKVSKTGYCQYFHGESMVGASRENSVLPEWGDKPEWEIDYKPLGLPVRSLKSSIIDHEIPECIKGNGSSPDSKGSCKVKPKSPFKSFLREKSVGIIRPSENVLEGQTMGDIYSAEDKVAKNINCDKFESRQNLDDFPLNQSSLSKHQNGERQEFAETDEVESEKDSESEFEKFQVSSEEEEGGSEEEEAQSENANGAELHPNEVDKKAGEFIAKFREQIRLQKIASVK